MRIAVAIDGSDNSFRAAQHAIFLTQHLPQAHLELIHVVDLSKAKDEFLLASSKESLSLQRNKKIKPIVDLAQAVQIEITTTILKGNPSREIINYVKKQKIDQLVVGSRGLNVFQEMVLGSVSHKVMKHAVCPVTVVK